MDFVVSLRAASVWSIKPKFGVSSGAVEAGAGTRGRTFLYERSRIFFELWSTADLVVVSRPFLGG